MVPLEVDERNNAIVEANPNNIHQRSRLNSSNLLLILLETSSELIEGVEGFVGNGIHKDEFLLAVEDELVYVGHWMHKSGDLEVVLVIPCLACFLINQNESIAVGEQDYFLKLEQATCALSACHIPLIHNVMILHLDHRIL